VKKLISIGVVLALVAIVVLPIGVAAQCEYDGIVPATYAKIPFAIIQSGFHLVGIILTVIGRNRPYQTRHWIRKKYLLGLSLSRLILLLYR